MRKLLLFIVPFLFCGAAEAARITCRGETMGYQFLIRANTSGSRVVGAISTTVWSESSGGRQTSVNLRPVASEIRPGSFIQFSGQGSGFSGAVAARYDRSSGLYSGNMSVQVGGTTGSGQVNCRLSEPRGSKSFGIFEELEDFDELEE